MSETKQHTSTLSPVSSSDHIENATVRDKSPTRVSVVGTDGNLGMEEAEGERGSESESEKKLACNTHSMSDKKHIELLHESSLAATVTPKYPTGTRFVKDSDKYGRIVGFDGELYQVYYPQDGTCDSFTEKDFDEVKFIKPHKRPSQCRRPVNEEEDDKVPRCPKCMEIFSSNPLDKTSGHAPLQSQNCSHVICIDCIQAMRMSSSQSNSRLRSTVDCPFCKKPKSFNAAEPTICLPMCQMVALYNKMELKRGDELKREKVQEQQRKERKDKSNKRQRSSKDGRTESKQRSKHDGQKKDKISSKSSLKTACLSNIKCTSCKKDKLANKFSSKQLERANKEKQRVLCRRCEEKGNLQKQLGSGFDKVSTTLLVAKEQGSKPKFLTTIVPYENGAAAAKQSNPLPSNLTLDGYSREPWSRFANDDLQQEELWTKSYLWSTGDAIAGFLSFLKKHGKSAYGTFLLPDGTDGFFVIPFDQPPPPLETRQDDSRNVFQCKCILGLGLIGPKWEEGHASSSTLRKLLAAEFKTSQSLAEVPKGSVQVVKKLAGPAAPVSRGVQNWFRERIVIKEDEEDDKQPPYPLDEQLEVVKSNCSPHLAMSAEVEL